jgi:GT2 family glycosyltransferase
MMTKTALCMAVCIRSEKRLDDLKCVFDSLVRNLVDPADIVIVDDCSVLASQVDTLISRFGEDMRKEHPYINVIFTRNETNLKPSATFNKAMMIALGQPTPADVLIHIEDDIVVDYPGWNQVFAKFLQAHPEVGQVLPHGSGRSEWIPRPDYDEFPWGIGGLWAIPRAVFEKIGGWDETLVHQHEVDYSLRVRMGGWRIAQIVNFAMNHLGEGDLTETFEYQVQQHIGVYNFLKKWNRRFIGAAAYRDIWLMSFEDFPINVNFRRQLAAWFAANGKDECRMNQNPEPFTFPGHWGKYEVVKLIRSPGREREAELIEKMRDNFVFGDVNYLHTHIRNLANRLKKNLTDEEIDALIRGREWEYDWTPNGRIL